MLKRLAGAVIAIAVVLGMKFYNKHSSHEEVKKRLVQLCEGDAPCLQTVEQHFDACFEQSYRMGGRRTSSTLKSEEMVKCLNEKGGVEYFEVTGK